MKKFDQNFQYGLQEEEVALYNKFIKIHKCNPKNVGAMIEEDCAPTMSEIILNMSSIGMYPTVKCLACGTIQSIASEERINSA